MARGDGDAGRYYGPQSVKKDWKPGDITQQPHFELRGDPSWELVGQGGPGEGQYQYIGSPPAEPEPTRHHEPAAHHMPAAHHGGGSDLSGFQSMFEQMMERYDKLLDAYLNPPGGDALPGAGEGFASTVLTRRVLGDEEARRPGLFPVAPQRQVMDPVTGAVYPSPAAALAAGVTSWQYVPLPETGSTEATQATTGGPAVGAVG